MPTIDEKKRDKRNKIDNSIVTKLFKNKFQYANFEYKENVYESIDMCATGITYNANKATYDIEVKSRDIKTTAFTNSYMEVMKYDAMLSGKYTNNKKIYVAIYHLDNIIYIWDIEKINDIKQYQSQEWMLEITESHQYELVLKDVFKLPLKLAKEYPYDCTGLYNEVYTPKATYSELMKLQKQIFGSIKK